MTANRVSSILLGVLMIASSVGSPVLAQGGDQTERPAGWEDYSHGNETAPDYEVVFPQDDVNVITITIAPENWQTMLDDMTELYGPFGTRSERDGAGPGQVPPGGMRPEGGAPPDGGQRPPGMDGGGQLALGTDENPIWVAVDITFGDQTWTNVGMRFKGNSSLMSAWGEGIWKLPFKLDFDQFEDEYPAIDNQRFFGFKQLSFSSGFSDPSLLREKVTADIFRAAGVPSAQTAFYAVYVDYGAGPVYFGLYTAVEVVDDTVIETQFADDSGNVYKPEGNGATFAAGSFDEASFDKETNQAEADYSDVLALFAALHAETRTTDPAAWRDGLEAVFDVDGFVRWLAVNMVVQNWDTYGQMAHNYYLYADPLTGLLTWIPWDNNMALAEGRGGPGRGRDGQRRITLDLEGVGEDWPLIRYLMDDPVYHALYVSYVEETITGAFEPARMTAIYQAMHDLIAPYVVGEHGELPGHSYLNVADEFEIALTALIAHVNERYTTAQDYLAGQTVGEAM